MKQDVWDAIVGSIIVAVLLWAFWKVTRPKPKMDVIDEIKICELAMDPNTWELVEIDN